jgi:hypothetical protein
MIPKIIPSYLYQQYADDANLQALVTAYNTLAQQYLDWFNTVPLPVYTSEQLTGEMSVPIPGGLPVGFPFSVGGVGNYLQNPGTGATTQGGLLDWVAQGLYGYPRPVLSQTTYTSRGGFNTSPFNASLFGGFTRTPNGQYYIVNDDIYKRCLTWNFYKADGLQFSAKWLKRRVARFLQGVNGVDIGTDDTSYISVQYGYTGTAPLLVPLTQTVANGLTVRLAGFNSAPFARLAFNRISFNAKTTRTQVAYESVPEPLLNHIVIRLVTITSHVTGGALFNRMRFGTGRPFGTLQFTHAANDPQQMSKVLQAAMAAGVLNIPSQYTCTIQTQ